MSSWRQRLCGTIALRALSDQSTPVTKEQILNPSETMSNGGSFSYESENAVNMKTFKGNFLLPTEHYSVLMFKDDGNAIIYSDNDKNKTDENDTLNNLHFSSDPSNAH